MPLKKNTSAEKKPKTTSKKVQKIEGEEQKTKKTVKIPLKKLHKNPGVAKKQEKQQQEHTKKWENLYKKAQGVKPATFRISNAFSEKTALKHPVFGWGWVISNKNDRLHVMFKDKTRVLLSNQNVILNTMRKK